MRLDSPGDLSLEEGCEVPLIPRINKLLDPSLCVFIANLKRLSEQPCSKESQKAFSDMGSNTNCSQTDTPGPPWVTLANQVSKYERIHAQFVLLSKQTSFILDKFHRLSQIHTRTENGLWETFILNDSTLRETLSHVYRGFAFFFKKPSFRFQFFKFCPWIALISLMCFYYQ